MNTPDLRKYHHALVLADCGSYARASERLHLSQSALSRSIQALEQALGLTLFHRSKRGVQLSREGESVLTRARALLLQAQGLEREIKLLKSAERGHLAFGVGPAMPSLFLPELLVGLNRARPTLSIDVTIDSPPRLLELLRLQAIEFFVADQRTLPAHATDGLSAQLLVQIDPAFFVRRDHPLTGDTISPAALSRFTLLSPQFRTAESTPDPQQERAAVSRFYCNDLTTLRRVLLETDAVLLGLKPMVQQELAQGKIRQLRVSDTRHREATRIALVRRAERTASAAAQAVTGMIEKLLAQ